MAGEKMNIFGAEKNMEENLNFDRYFEKSKKRVVGFLNRVLETDYGRKLASDFEVDPSSQNWDKIPLLTPDKYKNPLDFVLSDEKHPKEDMIILYSGGTTGRPKETYWTKEDIKVELPPDVIDRIEKCNFVFLSEKKKTISATIIEESTKSISKPKEFKGFDTAEEFLDICEKSQGDIYLTLQVSSCRRLISELKKISSSGSASKEFRKLNNLNIDLLAEPVTLNEIKECFSFFKETFKVEPEIEILYSSTELKKIGLYQYKPGDTEIWYKVVDGKLIESLDPITKKKTSGIGDLVVTDIKKEYGSIYPRYVSGDRAKIKYDENGICYIGEISRNPEFGQINVRGEKVYSQSMWSGIQEKVGFQVPIKMQFQLLENKDKSKSVLDIKVLLDSSFSDANTENLVRKAVEEFMNDDYRYLWKDGKEVVPGKLYKNQAEDFYLEISYINRSEEDFQKAYRTLPSGNLEKFREVELENILDATLKEINEIENKSKNFSNEEIIIFWKKIREVIRNENFSQISEDFFNTDKWRIISKKIRDFGYNFEIEDEKDLSELAKKPGGLEKVREILGTTAEKAKLEVDSLKLNKNSKVCFVGGGSLPISAIEYAKLGVGEIDILEIDQNSVNNATILLRDNGISNISVKLVDGMSADYSPYDAVVIAAMVDIKDELANKINKEFNKKVLLRAPFSKLAEMSYSPSKIESSRIIDYGDQIMVGKILE
jgi:hypothetical protein